MKVNRKARREATYHGGGTGARSQWFNGGVGVGVGAEAASVTIVTTRNQPRVTAGRLLQQSAVNAMGQSGDRILDMRRGEGKKEDKWELKFEPQTRPPFIENPYPKTAVCHPTAKKRMTSRSSPRNHLPIRRQVR